MKNAFVLRGALEASLRNGFRTTLQEFMTSEEAGHVMTRLRKDGLAGPLCYYKLMAHNGRNVDDASEL